MKTNDQVTEQAKLRNLILAAVLVGILVATLAGCVQSRQSQRFTSTIHPTTQSITLGAGDELGGEIIESINQ